MSAYSTRSTKIPISRFYVCFISYKYGYHNAYFDAKETLVSSLVATAGHFLLALITLFSPWIAGATKHIGGFIAFGDRYASAEYMKNIPMLTLVIIGIVTALLYAGLLLLGTQLGVKKRLEDRAELIGEKESFEK